MAKVEMTEAEKAYNFPPSPAGGSPWADGPGAAAALLPTISRFHERARVGEEAPDFTGRLLDGGEFSLSGLRGRNIFLMFGSLSDPPCSSNVRTTRPSLAELHAHYQPRGVEFIWIYTREAFPADGLPAHRSFEQKIAQARRFREEEGVPFPIVVDSLDGTIHKLYGESFHNANFLINWAGVIIFKASHLDASELPAVFEDILFWQRIDTGVWLIKKSYSERIRMCQAPYDIAAREKEWRALERSGPGVYERLRERGFDPLTWKREK
jgi:peroxiredoxin